MIEFSVSVLCYNREELTRYCLRSVLRWSPPSPDVCEIIITDNGSTDGTRRMLDLAKRDDRRVRVIRHAQNLGVIKAKNLAFKASGGRYFVSLDNDASVRRGWLEALRTPVLADPKVAQVGRQAGFGTLDRNGTGTRGDRLDYIDGSCFLVRSDVARALGGVCDEAFEFAYCEDADFSLRLRKAGWKIALAPAPVNHSEHKTAHGAGLDLRRFWTKNHALLKKRWAGYLETGKLNGG